MTRLLLPAALLLLAACAQPPEPRPAVEVRDAWARATAPGQSGGAIYATLASESGDTLTAAATERAATTTVHSTATVDGVSRMRMVGQVEVPAGTPVTLAPGGTHLMLDGVNGPLVAGQTLPLALTFAKAGTIKVDVAIVAPGSR